MRSLSARCSSSVQTLWWQFLPPSHRDARAAAFERFLRRQLDAAATPGLKSSWFRAIRAVGTTPETVAWLRALWQRKRRSPGCRWSRPTRRRWRMALALRDVADATALLDIQAARISNADRRARFTFLRGAVSTDVAERERWFDALASVEGRRHETWVAEGLGYLHHPLRADASAPLVPKALEMLAEVNRTGDLFFDSAWLGATLSGHSSPAVAVRVQAVSR